MTQRYERLRVIDLNRALGLIRESYESTGEPHKRRRGRDKGPKVDIDGVSVRIGSLRLLTFALKGTVCVECGKRATHFALERPPGQDGSYHLNLWAANPDGTETLFTHDHIHQRSTGGRDELDNCQPMCQPCNQAKAAEEQKLFNALSKR